MTSTLKLPPSPADRTRNWLSLPEELTASILERVGTVDMMRTGRKVCKTWRRICSDPAMWRVVKLAYYGYADIDLNSVARKAVDLSCGQLMDIRINYLGNDDLLRYISDRSSQLRRLSLSSCNGMTSKGLSEMFKKLPLLEELHLKYMPISKQAIEVAGSCCPRLKSFKLNNHGYRCPYIGCNEDALAIAENLHGLRHLQLFNNKITVDGLLAILDNCSHLESLDIRKCFNVNELGSDLKRRLSQQIKDLRLPDDSTEDRGFDTEMHNCESCNSRSGPTRPLHNCESCNSRSGPLGPFYSDMFSDEFYNGSDIDSDYLEEFADDDSLFL